MKFIVTGGAGFIGSHLTEELLAENHSVIVVDNLSTGSLQNLPNHPQLKFLHKDILTCQPDDFPDQIDGIAHLAATPSVTDSWLNPLESHHNNLSAIISVILLCQALNIPRLVFASSAAVYGNKTELPIVEEQETSPISPYGLQKLVSEKYGNLFAKEVGLSFIALRFFNVFGPRQMPNSPYSGVISIFTKAMAEGLPITIYGDGQQTRDFIYVKDVAIAISQALTLPLAPGSCISCNLGTGNQTSLLDLVDILKSCFPNWNEAINLATPRTGDIQHSQGDISKIKSLLGFTPQWSVASGLSLLVESIKAK
ncbi:MAG TPA: UDP-glucose 4-epimerase [Cyanobacteria bacterium UBA11149]|nr:UDP-glucose 4-epimerase [Cyanobacteria bacterium UBA11367]HBE56164.1 UDP-glucose 4-epimerase [Cyanobacteria bacterium UBA11366]HBK62185.1 UDP-glucose 4-epimerase [Cyanobacteria bacterium UBA11166]HBR73906.1 UDP-glucose 4-epimerase [Cyanobacteria bacterium UBA11159]HBS70209.1 UDP-glucose 4-epimerase [Cyanobacteria bacterium UBA11153]HBW90842.1 UDP-glucose 4-epimerase [Cyanobacteria bacterium UBA11149]HCA96336.1 UDP-glucose 4-epimerase [Cyanobacteria bacterium UBA9226]